MAELAGDPLIEFGDHSYDHPHMSHLPVARIVEEIDQTEAALARYGKHSVAFRPPFGEWSHRLVYVVQELRLPTVTWDVVSGDPSAQHDDRRDDPERPRQGAPGFDHHLSHQRARLEDGGGAAGDPAAGCASAGSASCRCRRLMASASAPTAPGPTPAPANPVVVPIPIAPGSDTPPPVAPLRAATLPPPLPPAGHAAP